MTLPTILTPDLVNGSFELLGALSIANNIRQLIKDKLVKGVSLWSTCFFTSWGLWNLYYYPHLDQMYSFGGGVALCITNVIWLVLARKYWKMALTQPVVLDFDAVCEVLDKQSGVETTLVPVDKLN